MTREIIDSEGKARGRKLEMTPFARLSRSKSHAIRSIARFVLFIGLRGRKFDALAYSTWRGDLISQGIDPFIHAAVYGIRESVLGFNTNFELTTSKAGDAKKPWLLVVTHDMSRTGGPILALSLSKYLGENFNVVTLTLGRGVLEENFHRSSNVLAQDYGNRKVTKNFQRRIKNLCRRYQFSAAYVNSIESVFSIAPLAMQGVDSIALIHEYAAYSRTDEETIEGLRAAKSLIFSSALTRDSFLPLLNSNLSQRVRVLHQGHCEIPISASKPVALDAKFRESVDTAFSLKKSEVPLRVMAAGYIQYRKGPDLFISLAAKITSVPGFEDSKFLWVGDGFDPRTIEYGAYLQDQIERSNLATNVSIINSSEDFEYALSACDVFALTSRLDPFPNVVIDSLKVGKPAFVFKDCSGYPEIFDKTPAFRKCVAPYLDVDGMAELIISLVRSLKMGSQPNLSREILDFFDKEFSFQTYVDELLSEARELRKN